MASNSDSTSGTSAVRLVLFFSLLSALLILAGPLAAEETTVAETVTLQLKWQHQFQFAGYYAAVQQGYYQDAGLRVILKEGGPAIKVDEEVVTGRADFGVLASELVQKRSEGSPIKLLAVILQHSPRAIIVRADSGIHGPADLIGKKLMINRNEEIEFQSMFHDEGIDYQALNIILKDDSANQRFLNGEIDGLNGSIGNQPFLFRQRGVEVTLIRPISYGTDFYGDSLFTSEEQVHKDPQRIKRFVEASLRGWQYAMEHPEEIAELITSQYSPHKSREQLLFEAAAMRKLIVPDLVDLGHINPQRLERIAQIYASRGLIAAPAPVRDLIYRIDDNGSFDRIIFYLKLALLIAAACGVILLLLNRRLNHLVKRRTRELQENHTLLNSIIEGTSDAIFVKNLEGRYIMANQGTLASLGKSREEVIGKSDEELFESNSAEVIKKNDSPVMHEGTSILAEEKLQTAYGETYWLTNKAPYLDHQGKVIGLLGISRNITELKKAESEKQQLLEQLHQAQKIESLGTLAGGIAHDFNNILAAILGYAELLSEDLHKDSPLANYNGEIIKASKRAKNLVSQILTFSRKSGAHAKVLVSLDKLILEVLQLLRATIPTTIRIEHELTATRCLILADPTQIHQVLLNLCTNATQAMETRGGTLTISLSETILQASNFEEGENLAAGRYLRLRVADTGPGMDETTVARIFEPYFTTKKTGKGSGLGLSVVLGIVKNHQGQIRVESTPGAGSVFDVYLRGVDESSPDAPLPEPTLQPRGQETILVVDDEPALVSITSDHLRRLGYRTIVRSDSREALATFLAQAEHIDLLITDQTMPAMTGIDLARRVLEVRPGLPVILCTGFSSTVDPESARQTGIQAFLEKPVTRETLSETVRRLLDHQTTIG